MRWNTYAGIAGPGLLFAILFLCGCHSTRWSQAGPEKQTSIAPQSIQDIFQKYPQGILRMEALVPGYNYDYDVGEKAQNYGKEDGSLRFGKVEMSLCPLMPTGKILCNIKFLDGRGSSILIPKVDLMRLIPIMNAPGDMVYPEIILEELNRFGISFRREHEEFYILNAPNVQANTRAATEKAYRASLTNNCLTPGKWEFAMVAEDYADFEQRKKSGLNLNQNRILAHSWFQVDEELYFELLQIKNPGTLYNAHFNFDSISDLAEQVVIDYEQLRHPIRRNAKIEMVEIGHQSGRKIEPVDVEEYYKREFGLFLNRDTNLTYSTILDQEVVTAQFRDEGFYRTATPRKYKFDWMRYMDSVSIDIVDVPGSGAYVELKLTGKWVPYEITIGNVDLALLDEQKMFGMLFGFHTYPKSRRFNPTQSTIAYDPDLLPADLRPYVLLTDKKTGKWINNQYKGIEKVYLGYESREKDVLEIYVLSYERITPVWMSRLKLSNRLRETVRVRNSLYNY